MEMMAVMVTVRDRGRLQAFFPHFRLAITKAKKEAGTAQTKAIQEFQSLGKRMKPAKKMLAKVQMKTTAKQVRTMRLTLSASGSCIPSSFKEASLSSWVR